MEVLALGAALLSAEAGDDGARASTAEHLNTLYRYFHLCQEQVLLRQSNAVDVATWKEWHAQMRRNFERPLIRDAWSSVRTRDPDAFAGLAELFAGAFTDDDPRRPVPDLPARQAARPPAP
jgi:hypothetical protein